MAEKLSNEYDAIIIGAGISGLVCGCYLAKAGLKTLIIEKNASPGGYCTSFNRHGYFFDACVHGLSSLRQGGILNKVVSELELYHNIEFHRHNPSDTIYTNEFKIQIYSEIDKTISEFQRIFPLEKEQINNFFTFIKSGVFSPIRNKTYYNLLNSFFSDAKLKAIFSMIIIQLLGYNPYRVSAMVACLLLREFILDGGYYPLNGIKDLPECLAQTYKRNSGTLLFNTTAQIISGTNNNSMTIRTNPRELFKSKYIVSACDLKQTFFKLISKTQSNFGSKKLINSLKPSLSAFIVYLGLNYDDEIKKNLRSNIWFFQNLNMCTFMKGLNMCHPNAMVITCPTSKGITSKHNHLSLSLATIVPYRNNAFWNIANRNKLELQLINSAEMIFPGLSKNIKVKFNACPTTLYNWTRNYKGAAFGWAGIPNQFGNPEISQKTTVPNLFVTGHWSNLGGGIASVVNCGKTTASQILKKEQENI